MAQQLSTLQPIPARPPRPARRGSWALMLFSWLLALAVVAGTALWRYETVYAGRIYEGVSAAGINLGGLSQAEAEAELGAALASSIGTRVTLRVGDRVWHPTLAELGIHVDAAATAAKALEVGRQGTLPGRLSEQGRLLQQGADVAPVMTRNPVAIDALLSRIAREVAREPRDAQLLVEGLVARALPATRGFQLDLEASAAAIVAAMEAGKLDGVDLVLQMREPLVADAQPAADQVNAFLTAPLTLRVTTQEFQELGDGVIAPTPVTRSWTIDRARVAELIRVEPTEAENGQRSYRVLLDPGSLRADLEGIAADIAREPREARFDYNPQTDTLTPLVISQDGLALDVVAAQATIDQALDEGRHAVDLPVTVTPPTVSTADAEALNIHGLAVEGRSNFKTSPPNREVNVIETARRMHGVVIPPGGIFSFNEYLGWVVDATGYEEGYIIVGNETQVDVGGGVCQVSTTVFRAALNAGFPIVERHAHAYRVSYYENDSAPGLDATVFSPWVDLKFKNDTNNYYLMESEWNSETKDLAIRLYGADTGRQVQMAGPNIIRETPPGPTIYVDDPTRPRGQVEQVDWSHPGADVNVARIVRDKATGQELFRDEFFSAYKPWSARFVRGTGN